MANKRIRESHGRAGAQYNQHQMRTRGKKNTFSLLALPPELRNHIYHLVLGQERIVVQITSGDEAKNYPHDAVPTRALTQVCRQIRQESLPIYFHINKFIFRSVFYSKPQFSSLMIPDNYLGRHMISCLNIWLQKRVPAKNLSALNQIELSRSPGCVQKDRDTSVAADHFWHSELSFGSLGVQLDWYAEFLYAGMDHLIPPSVLLQPIRESSAAWIPAPLLDQCLAAYTGMARMARHDATSNSALRRRDRNRWRFRTLAPEDQILVRAHAIHLKPIIR